MGVLKCREARREEEEEEKERKRVAEEAQRQALLREEQELDRQRAHNQEETGYRETNEERGKRGVPFGGPIDEEKNARDPVVRRGPCTGQGLAGRCGKVTGHFHDTDANADHGEAQV